MKHEVLPERLINDAKFHNFIINDAKFHNFSVKISGFIILVLQEYTSKKSGLFHDFFSTCVQFQDFSGPEK